MTTGKFLIIIFAVLGALSGLAYIWTPKQDFGGKIPIVWVSDNNPVRAAQIEAFNRENPDLHLYLDYNNSGAQKVVLQCSSGVGPDLFDYGDFDQQSYVEAGILWDVTEAADKMGFSVRKQGWPGGLDAGLCFGRQYGYYCNIGANILIYNKNVFDYFGVPYPKEQMTWEEFLTLTEKVTSPAATPTNKRIYALTDANWKYVFESHRGEYFTEEGMLNLRTPELRNGLQWHKDMLFKFKVMPTSLDMKQMSGQGGWGTGSLNQFASGRFAMMFNGDWTLIAFTRAYLHQLELQKKGEIPTDASEPFNKPLRLGATLVPHVAGMQPWYKVGSRMSGINVQSPRREQALRVLKYFAGPTYSELINEGMDWLPGNPEYADLGLKEGPPELSRMEMHDMTKKAVSYGYVPRSSPFLLMTDLNRVLASQVSRMESNSGIPVEELISSAEEELKVLMRRNIDRSPELKKLYDERLKLAESRKSQSSLPTPP